MQLHVSRHFMVSIQYIIDFTICTFIQGIAHYLFNPAVATLGKIDDSSINTSFYSLAGANFEEDVLVESILLEVCPTYTVCTVYSSVHV